MFFSVGVNSAVTSSIIVGLVSQLWLRNYHPGWYRKYNYILGGALDGGTEVMIFILSYAVFGASGVPKPFPKVSFFWFVILRTVLLIRPFFFFSGQGTLLKEILIIVMATGRCID